MRIISQRLRMRRQRELLRAIWSAIDASDDLSAIKQALAQRTQHLENERVEQKWDDVVFLLLILALVWFGGRFLMEL